MKSMIGIDLQLLMKVIMMNSFLKIILKIQHNATISAQVLTHVSRVRFNVIHVISAWQYLVND